MHPPPPHKRIGLYLRRPGWAWQSLFHPPPYPKYEYPQGNPPNPALAALIHALPAFPNLDALALEYRNVRCEDCLVLAAAIAGGRACGRLRSLNVSSNFLRKEGGKALGACLRQLHDLRELVLNDNSIYYEGVSMCGLCCPAWPISRHLLTNSTSTRSRGGHLRGLAGRGLPKARALLACLQLGRRPG